MAKREYIQANKDWLEGVRVARALLACYQRDARIRIVRSQRFAVSSQPTIQAGLLTANSSTAVVAVCL